MVETIHIPYTLSYKTSRRLYLSVRALLNDLFSICTPFTFLCCQLLDNCFDDASACFCLCSSLTVSCLHMLLYCKVSHFDDDIDLRHVYIVTEYRIVVLG